MKTVTLDGTIENKPIGFEFDLEIDDTGLVDVRGCDIIFRENLKVPWKIIPVDADKAGYLWDRLDADTQEELVRDEDDPLDRDV